MMKTYKAKNTKTGQVKEFKTRIARENFINRKNNEYGAYLWSQVF